MRVVAAVLLLVLLLVLLGAGVWAYTPDRSRAALEAEYRVTEAEYRDIAGLRVRYRDTGPRDGPALLLLHGFGSSLETWEGWAGLLQGKYRVIRLDLPGFGLTGADPSDDYSDARGSEVLAGLLDALGVRRAVVIGNSLGGKLAWAMAAAQPERVRGLVLVSPDGFRSPGFEYGQAPSIPPLLRLLPYSAPKVLLRQSLAPAYADPARLSDTVVQRYWDMLRAPGVRRAILARTAQLRLTDPAPVLARIEVPVLLLWGLQDRMIPVSHAADYLAALPHARLSELAGLGHVPFEEDPAGSVGPLMAFLHEHDGF